MEGERIPFHVVHIEGNKAPALLGMDWLMKYKCVIDYHLGKISFKDDPNGKHIWYRLPRTEKGLLLMPLTQAAVDRLWNHEKDEYVSMVSSKEVNKPEAIATAVQTSSE